MPSKDSTYFVYQCAICGKRLHLNTKNNILGPHKNKKGLPCTGQKGIFIEMTSKEDPSEKRKQIDIARAKRVARVIAEKNEDGKHYITVKYTGKKFADLDRERWTSEGYEFVGFEELSKWQSWNVMSGFLGTRNVIVTYRKTTEKYDIS